MKSLREIKLKSIYEDFVPQNIRLMLSSFSNPIVPSRSKQQTTANSFRVVTQSFVAKLNNLICGLTLMRSFFSFLK